MPQQYSEIKQSYLKRGKSLKEAKRLASMTYIANGRGGTRSERAEQLRDDPAPITDDRALKRTPVRSISR